MADVPEPREAPTVWNWLNVVAVVLLVGFAAALFAPGGGAKIAILVLSIVFAIAGRIVYAIERNRR